MQTQETRQNFTATQGLIEEQDLSKKDQRIRKAVILYYAEDMKQQDIADEIGVSRQTVSKYLNSDRANAFKKFFSDKEKHEIKRWIEEMIARSYNETKEGLEIAKQRAIDNPEINPHHLATISLSHLNADDKFVELLQEMQIIQKPKERKEVEQTNKGPAEVNISFTEVEQEEEIEDEG
jgi:DNA-directed RNA polymerase specialized sigma subunit